MQITNSVCIVDFFPEAFIADEGVKRFIKRVTFPNDYGKNIYSWSVITAQTFRNEVNERLAGDATVTDFNFTKCPDSYTPCAC